MINLKFLIMITAMITFIFTGCATELPDAPEQTFGTLHYHGPDLSSPEDTRAEEPAADEPDPDAEDGFLSILEWLPFEEKFPDGIPREDREEDYPDGTEPEAPEGLPDPPPEIEIDVLMDFEEELLIPADSDPEYPLPVTGNGEVWGRDNNKVFATEQENRFEVLLDNWYVDNYTVAHYNAQETDTLTGVGIDVTNQNWYWVERTAYESIQAGDLPINRDIVTDDRRTPVTVMGLQMQTGSTGEQRRGLYLAEINLTQDNNNNDAADDNDDDEDEDNNNENDNDNNDNAITIQNNPYQIIPDHPDLGGIYEGWATIVSGYLPEGGEMIIRNGDNGIMEWPDGTVYEGSWKDDKRHGNGTFTWPDGREYTGEWVEGIIEGEGTLAWPDGREYSGEWRDGLMHGTGTLTWFDGEVPLQTYEGRWVNGTAEGRGTMSFDDGSSYTGSWSEGMADGTGTFTGTDDEQYTGQFSEGSPDGQGTMRWPDGRRHSGEWQDGTMHGGGTWTDDEGVSTRGRWDEGEFVL